MRDMDMSPTDIKIQACGCISLPEQIILALGIGIGSTLQMAVNAKQHTITLVAPLPGSYASAPQERAACPNDSEHP